MPGASASAAAAITVRIMTFPPRALAALRADHSAASRPPPGRVQRSARASSEDLASTQIFPPVFSPPANSICFQNGARSEEHTSELQSLRHLVCRLLLEKKKNKTTQINNTHYDNESAAYHIANSIQHQEGSS